MSRYSPIAPGTEGTIALDNGHNLYWQEAGNPDGQPLLILHGGPGGSIRPYYRQLVDPQRFRMILYDQRGCGQSRCDDALTANDTPRLVSDIDRLRKHLAIDTWCILGGSWGSTLALAYAQTDPASVSGLIVTGIYLAREVDRNWWWYGARQIFPDAWAQLREFLSEPEWDDLRNSYLRRVLSDDPEVAVPAGLQLMLYEAQLLGPQLDQEVLDAIAADREGSAAMGRMFCHYDRHASFLREGQLLEDADKLCDIPGSILAGRLDACTPPDGAYQLASVWPGAELRIIERAGHRWDDPLLSAAISAASERLLYQLNS